jgi:hypothetical protein
MNTNLVIHPNDTSTDFLCPIYQNISDAIILRGGTSKKQVSELINKHNRIIMLGHGSPFGLFTVGRFKSNNGYIIDYSMVELLRNKECISIWCNADKFMKHHKLNGFYSGMFISEVGEAYYCGLPGTTQDIVDESNFGFCNLLSECINEPQDVMYDTIRKTYGEIAEHNPVAHYNFNRLYLQNEKI